MPGSPDVFLRENLLLLADHLGEPKFMARCVRDKCHVSSRDPAYPLKRHRCSNSSARCITRHKTLSSSTRHPKCLTTSRAFRAFPIS